jgi:hypothetical protein
MYVEQNKIKKNLGWSQTIPRGVNHEAEYSVIIQIFNIHFKYFWMWSVPDETHGHMTCVACGLILSSRNKKFDRLCVLVVRVPGF